MWRDNNSLLLSTPKQKGGRNMSGQALAFMLVMWGSIALLSFMSLRTVLKNK